MEFAGSAYLFNLSLVAMGFAAVSVLVMIMRQTMGGKMSKFDIFLITLYVSLGFAAAVNAVLPELIALLHLPEPVTWMIASLIAAVIQAMTVLNINSRRHRAAPVASPPMAVVAYSTHWTAVALYLLNAGVPMFQGPALHAIAVTVSLCMAMWTFVRRISLLLGDKPGDDWDAGQA
jgi:hypothetical protein